MIEMYTHYFRKKNNKKHIQMHAFAFGQICYMD